MPRLRALTVALVLGAGLLLANALTAAAISRQTRHGGQDFPPRSGGTPVLVVTIPTQPPPPSGQRSPGGTHSALSQQAALHIAITDRYVSALARGKPYRIGRVTALRAGKRITLAFYRLATITGWWLHSGRRPYHATYRHVVALRVDVSSTRRQVTAIAPQTH